MPSSSTSKYSIRRNYSPSPPLSVSNVARNDHTAFSSNLHRQHSFIPSRDDASRADGEAQGPPTILRRVELPIKVIEVVEPPGVVHFHCLPRGRLSTGALHKVD